MEERAQPVAVAPGDILAGKYTVERVLGRGGMGIVVAARHKDLGELFAIKLLLPQAATQSQAVDRFLREARAAARLKGEHVAKVSDMGRLDYVETSIPSFYYEVRIEPEMVARRDWTRQWWSTASSRHQLVTSVAVIDELEGGDFPSRADCLHLVGSLPLVPVEPAIEEIVRAYIARHVMPADPLGDALHLALASYNRCDFLVTWNCKHLANANKFGHIRRVNALLGLYVPALVTPLELLGEDHEA